MEVFRRGINKVSIRFVAGKNSAKILSQGNHEKPWIQLFTDISKSNVILLIGRLKPKSSITRNLCTWPYRQIRNLGKSFFEKWVSIKSELSEVNSN